MPSQSPAAAPACPPQTSSSPGPIAESDSGTAILLIDRMQRVLDKAIEGMHDEVTLEHGIVDEMRAELAQVKLTLQRGKR
jgi:hypothetical protein